MVAARLFPEGPPPRPGREVSLLPEEVKDTFFAYVIGVIRSGVELDMDNAALMDVLTEFKGALDLPFEKVHRVIQQRGDSARDGSLSIEFTGNVTIPIPFSFLGYHPGSILASRAISFAEGRTVVPGAVEIRFTDPLYLMHLTDGYVTIKVDDWLKFLFPTVVDDLYVEYAAIFRTKGDWIGVLSGTGSRGTRVREIFNLTHNRIVFPVPKELEKLIVQIETDHTAGAAALSRTGRL
jgi:hypothetical protein